MTTETQAPDPAPTWQALREFLNGARSLDGVWFGERHPTKGMFWWRSLLPAAIPAPEGDERAVFEAWYEGKPAQHMAACWNAWVARAALAAPAPQAPAWQPIETAPKDGTPVDIWVSRWAERLPNMRRVEFAPGNVFYEPIVSGPTCVRNATHWMPIPAAPQTKEPTND